ncbi:MAG TPA: FkbM family methyltransferase [Flavitalea sp.]|nr:FkbM family methyltransferase [Flavitalea sp.]
MKTFTKRTLQRLLGFENYLYIFSIFTYNRLRLGLIEKEFLHFIDLIGKKEGYILDVGANIGVMSTLLAKRFPQSVILSFEPIPENIHVFKRITQHYQLKNVKLFEGALSDKPGETRMIMPVVDNVRMQGLSKVMVHESAEDGMIYTVPTWKLDEIPDLNKPSAKVLAIKMDVENYEYFVLQGGASTIAKHLPLIYCELWDNENRTRTFEMLRRLGYTVRIFENNKFEEYKGQPSTNFIFTPPAVATQPG